MGQQCSAQRKSNESSALAFANSVQGAESSSLSHATTTDVSLSSTSAAAQVLIAPGMVPPRPQSPHRPAILDGDASILLGSPTAYPPSHHDEPSLPAAPRSARHSRRHSRARVQNPLVAVRGTLSLTATLNATIQRARAQQQAQQSAVPTPPTRCAPINGATNPLGGDIHCAPPVRPEGGATHCPGAQQPLSASWVVAVPLGVATDCAPVRRLITIQI